MNKMSHYRIQLDVTEEWIGRLDKLTRTVDAISRAELVRRAVRIYGNLCQIALSGKGINLGADTLAMIVGYNKRSDRIQE